MSPLASWLLVAPVFAVGLLIAVRHVARRLEAREEWASIQEWHDMCNALELYDWQEEDE